MSWRGTEGAAIAAKSGHDAVLSPSPILYLDHFQSDSGDEPPGRTDAIDWKQLYAFDPVPAGLTQAERAHIIGVQGNLWTEHVRTTDYADRMLWPRAAVIAELGWSPPTRDWPGFSARLVAEFARYKALGLAYDQTPLEPLARFDEAPAGLQVTLGQPAAIGALHYTTDGSAPIATSPIAVAPLDIASGTRLKVQAFSDGAALGTVRSWTIAPALLRTRTASEMRLCSKSVALRLEDDGPTNGKRRVLWGNIMHPCWIWPDALLSGAVSIAADVGSLPFNFSLGADLKNVVFAKPTTPAGELQVRRDDCGGPVIATIPLAPAVANSGVTRLSGSMGAQQGRHDLCMTFTQSGPAPLWMLDRLTLEPAP
jgi:hexosaminidase